MSTAPLGRALGLVWNRRERRLRMPFRLAAGAVVLLLVGLVASLALAVLSARYRGGTFAAAFAGADAGVAVLAASSAVGALTVCTTAVVLAVAIDRRGLHDYGFRLRRAWWRDLGFGAVLGAGLMTLVFLFGLAVGWVRVVGVYATAGGSPPGTLIVGYAAVFAAVSLTEELLVRGILLTNLAEGLGGVGPISERSGTLLAVGLTSVLFGALHAGNPNATPASTAGITLAGVLLAIGYVLTGDLAIPLGVHLTWNYVQGVVYGFPVSGIRVGVALVETEVAGPAVLTGGRFGPEAGLVGIAAVLLGMGATAWWVRRQRGTLALEPSVRTPALRWQSSDR